MPADPRPLPRFGVLVPLVTPLLPDGTVDTDSLGRLLDFQLAAGVDGLLVVGSSGESVALSAAERLRAAAHAVAHVGERAHVMLGVPTQGTLDAAAEAAALAGLGPDSLLVAAPAGLRLSDSELIGHFRTIARQADAPVVAYEVPSRVGSSLSPDLIAALAADGIIAGVKDSSGNLTAGRVMATATRPLDQFVRYTGSEELIDASLLAGYDGTIPGLANVFPRFHVELVRRAARQDWTGARDVQELIIKLLDLYHLPASDASFSAQFYAVVKEALRQLGVVAHNTASVPLTPAGDYIAGHAARLLALGEDLADRLIPATAGARAS
jgi:4-hydroxy-tetrahydrodipicolinate synthase